jgi:hypothetical protein
MIVRKSIFIVPEPTYIIASIWSVILRQQRGQIALITPDPPNEKGDPEGPPKSNRENAELQPYSRRATVSLDQ